MTRGRVVIGRASVPPRPWPSLSSNSPPPPEDPQVHMHTNRHTPILNPRTPCFINAPRTSHCASPPLPSVPPLFSNVSLYVFFFSPPSATYPPMASGGSAGALTPSTGTKFQLRQESEGTPTVTSTWSPPDPYPPRKECLAETMRHVLPLN